MSNCHAKSGHSTQGPPVFCVVSQHYWQALTQLLLLAFAADVNVDVSFGAQTIKCLHANNNNNSRSCCSGEKTRQMIKVDCNSSSAVTAAFAVVFVVVVQKRKKSNKKWLRTELARQQLLPLRCVDRCCIFSCCCCCF